MRTNWFFPPPLTSTSTTSMPLERATRCAISSMRDDVACRIMNRTGCPPNKKVGFRPLDRFDTPRTIVQRMGRNASWVESTPRPPTGRAMWRMSGVLAELGRPLEGGPLGALRGDAALAAILPAAAPSGQSGDTENRFKNRVGRHSRTIGCPLEGGPVGAWRGAAALAAILPAAAPSGQSGDTENRFKNRVGRHSR